MDRLLKVRRWHRVRVADRVTLRVPVKRALPFVITADHNPHVLGIDALDLRRRIAPAHEQLDIFATGRMALTGQL